MSTWGNIAGGYLQAMPRIDARNQRAIENQRADAKQKMWMAQQQRQQDEYERLAKERAANNYVSMHPNIARGLMSGKVTEAPPEMQGASNIFTVGNTVSPQQKFAYDFALKQASNKPKLQLTTVMKDGVPMRAIVNLDTGEKSILDKAPPTSAPSAYVNMPGVNKFKIEEGKKASDWRTDVSKQVEASTSMLDMLDRMNQMTEAGFKPGILTPAKAFISASMQGLGFDPKAIGLDTADKYQAYRSLVQEYTFNLLKQQKGVQTEGDAKRAQEAFANAQNTEEANLLIAEYKRKIAERAIEYEQFVDENLEPDGSNFRKVQSKWHKYIKDHPLFPPKPKSNPAQAGAGLSDDDLEAIFNKHTKQPLQR